MRCSRLPGGRLFLHWGSTTPVVRNKANRKYLFCFDAECCRLRNLIERTFCRLEDFRVIVTRYDETAGNSSDQCVEVRDGSRKEAH